MSQWDEAPCDRWSAICWSCGWQSPPASNFGQVETAAQVHMVAHGRPHHMVTAIGECE